MNGAGIQIANRAGLQAQDLVWRSAAPVVPLRSRWPFTVMRKEQCVAFKHESSTSAVLNKPSFCFTT